MLYIRNLQVIPSSEINRTIEMKILKRLKNLFLKMMTLKNLINKLNNLKKIYHLG